MKVALVLLFACFGSPVQGQWILDKRCEHSRRVLEQNEQVEVLPVAPLNNGIETDAKAGAFHLRGLSSSNATKTTESAPFMLKLYWQPGFCWQDEWDERLYCFECDSPQEGKSRAETCLPGTNITVQFCEYIPTQQFVWVPNSNDNDEVFVDSTQPLGQLKMANFDLCLQRKTINTFQLEICNAQVKEQMVVGFTESSPFELHPSNDLEKCINSHHHPKPNEIIENRWCTLSRRANVNFWTVYRDEKAGETLAKLRDPPCSESDPCPACMGDCDTDNDCQGGLVCRQRHADEGVSAVPGCIGLPVPGADYCYWPDNFLRPDLGSGLRMREQPCSPDSPCEVCQGGCNQDFDCMGNNLRCFQRNNQSFPEPVPGCMGTGVPRADYCYAINASLVEDASPTNLELRNTDRECSPYDPCYQCTGDCDTDDDCFESLKCYMRGSANSLEPVPGCHGNGVAGKDYCYLPGSPLGTPGMEGNVPTLNGEVTVTPTEQVSETDSPSSTPSVATVDNHGTLNDKVTVTAPTEQATDAFVDDQNGVSGKNQQSKAPKNGQKTAAPAEAQQRDVANNNTDQNVVATEVPGKEKGKYNKTQVDSERNNQDAQPLLRIVQGQCSVDQPCGICMGDCDADEQCAGRLRCFQRRTNNPMRPVPGCRGQGVALVDYCADPWNVTN